MTPAERALLDYVELITNAAHRSTLKDVQKLRDSGWSEDQIAEAVYVTAMFAFFYRVADAFGVRGIRCEHKCDVEKTVKEMLAHKGPCVVDFAVETNEHVYPMVPSGKGLHEMELGTLA